MKIPIFIISYNRLDALKKAINSYLQLVDYSDIIIIDNNSDYVPLKRYYSILENKGVTVYKNESLKSVEDLNKLWQIIQPEISERNAAYYVVTDPDIELYENVPKNYFDILISFLNDDIKIVGPMLTIDDIPEDYPAYFKVLKRHFNQFWRKKPLTYIVDGKKIYYQNAVIDTTFGLLSSHTPYKRLLNGIRLYYPYQARHLDWYITPKNITEDQIHFLKTTNKEISHWLGSEYKSKSELTKNLDIYIVTDKGIEVKNIYRPKSSLINFFKNFLKNDFS